MREREGIIIRGLNEREGIIIRGLNEREGIIIRGLGHFIFYFLFVANQVAGKKSADAGSAQR